MIRAIGPVTITKTIEKCGDCRHCSHSGAITRHAIYYTCHLGLNDNGTARRMSMMELAWNQKTGDKKHDTFPSIVPPDWCPLRHGKEY